MKKSLLVFLSLLFVCVWTLPAAAETRARELTLYVAPEGSGVTVPAELPATYTIPVPGDPADYDVTVLGESVSAEGLTVVPKTRTFMMIGAMDGSVSEETDYVFGTSRVVVSSNEKNYCKSYPVTVADYSEIWLDEFIDAYIRDNIPASLTVQEKLEKVGAFIASYDYSVNHQTLKGMVLSGEGGDCWASTDAAIRFAERLGLRARVCADQNVSLFTGGHTYAVVYAAGVHYVVEAGYAGNAPRMYSVYALASPFRFSENPDGTLTLERYLGCERDITVPDAVDGKPVTAVAEQCFYLANRYIEDGIRSVRLPDTVKRICASCFYDCGALETLNLPASLETLEMGALAGCGKLTLTDAARNPRFTVRDGVLYTKDMKELVSAFAPPQGTFAVPAGVEKICDCAFYNCRLNGITFPDSLRDIGFAAFRYCQFSGFSLILPAGVTGIGYAALCAGGLNDVTILNPALVINNTKENNLCDQEDGSTINSERICGAAGSTAAKYAGTYDRFFSAPCDAVLRTGSHSLPAHTCAETSIACTVCGAQFANTVQHEWKRTGMGRYYNTGDPFFYVRCSVCGAEDTRPFDAAALRPGDADLDGSVTAADARLALRLSVGLDYADGLRFFVMNADGDEKISAADARLILRAAVGLENLPETA